MDPPFDIIMDVMYAAEWFGITAARIYCESIAINGLNAENAGTMLEVLNPEHCSLC